MEKYSHEFKVGDIVCGHLDCAEIVYINKNQDFVSLKNDKLSWVVPMNVFIAMYRLATKLDKVLK